MMIRIFDIFFSLLGLIILLPIIVALFLVGYLDSGAPIFSQERMGKDKKPFRLFKFRSMRINTQSLPTHLVNSSAITKWGSFLRKSKLDELPQLWNVLIGDMSFVGPRPNLFNQNELIDFREKSNIYTVRPGITGLAQIRKVDMSTPKLLTETDLQMIENMNEIKYLQLIFLTISGRGFGDRIVKNR